MDSKVIENLIALKMYHKSIGCALSKASSGSDVEDGYVMEKLQAFASRMGYKLDKIKKLGQKTTVVLLHLIEYEYMDGEDLNAIDKGLIQQSICNGESEGELEYHSKGEWKIKH